MELKDLEVNSYLLLYSGSRRRILLERMPYSGGARWAIRNEHTNTVLGKDDRWEYEPSPSNRDDAFYQKYRWDTAEEALKFWEGFVERWS